jgi:predicted porin
MNIPRIAAAAAAAAVIGAAGPAHAQTNVTLGGIADAAARHVANDGRGSIQSLVSGSNATSRLVVRGSEDLGGGLSAGFHLEHGLLLDSGNPAQATQFWDRRSTVSLVSRSLGEIRAGRDFVPSYVSWSRFDPFGYVGVGSSSNLVSAAPQGPIRSAFGTSPNSTVRSSNAVQGLLPGALGGLEGGVLVAAGEGGTAAGGQHKVHGLRVGYVAGPINVSAAYTRSQNDLTRATGAFEDTALGGAYDFGFMRVSLALRRFDHAGAAQKNLLLGAWVPVGGSGELKLSYNRADLSGAVGAANVAANDARQLSLGYVHSLSRRSALYGTVARIDNGGAAAYAIPGGPAGLAGGGASTGAEVGVRHTF